MAGQADADALIGQVLDGRYRIDARVGHGGMGSVYRAWHVMMEQRVAVKVLSAERADDPTYARRFVREAKSTFRFDHPNCVRVSDFSATADGILYLVMEYLDGRTVGQELHYDGPIAALRVAHIAAQMCDALDHAHTAGFVHRDLKPDNVMLIKRGDDPDFVKVLDFGLAKFVDDSGAVASKLSLSPLTREGMVFGTPEYMSPEQASGKKLAPTTDLYSVGAVVYQMLTGLVPFDGASFMQILTRHVKEKPVAPATRRPDLEIPSVLDRIVMWCLEKDPARRPPSATELAGALREAEATLRRATSRIPAKLAASETLDLGGAPVAELVAVAAAVSPPRASQRITAPERPAQRAAAEPAPPARPPPPAAPTAQMPTGSIRATAIHQRRQRITAIAVVTAVFLGVAGVTATALWMDRGGEARPRKAPVPAPSKVASEPGRKPEHRSDPAPDPVPVNTSISDAGADADADAGSGRKVRPGSDVREAAGKSPEQKLAEAHVRNAEAAAREQNHLRAMAEAQTALRHDRHNRQARILFGQALIANGDKKRGCAELRRFRRQFERAGCGN